MPAFSESPALHLCDDCMNLAPYTGQMAAHGALETFGAWSRTVSDAPDSDVSTSPSIKSI
jgi:hypothetical protein